MNKYKVTIEYPTGSGYINNEILLECSIETILSYVKDIIIREPYAKVIIDSVV